MITGFAGVFTNMFYLLAIIVLLIILIGAIGVLRDYLRALFTRNKLVKVNRKIVKIEKKANEILNDFNKGLNFMGLAKAEMLTEDLEELDKLFKNIEKDNKKKKA